MTKLSIAIGGEFGESVTDEFLDELREDIEDELRCYWGGSGITIEIAREAERPRYVGLCGRSDCDSMCGVCA